MQLILVWAIPLLYGLCFGSLVYAFLQIIKTGAESYSSVYTEKTSRQLEDIFFFIPPRRLMELAWISSVACFTTAFLLAGDFRSMGGIAQGLAFGLAAGGLALMFPRKWLQILQKRRLERFNEQLVDALMTMSNALKSGSSILQAFEHIVQENQNPISQEFDLFLKQTRLGVKLEEALANLDRRVGSEDLTLMISAIETARQTGGNLTEVFEKISSTIRERLRIQGRIRMLTSQGRLQGIVVGVMPILLALAMMMIDPRMMSTFFHSTLGITIIGVVVLLETLGALMIRKIISIDI